MSRDLSEVKEAIRTSLTGPLDPVAAVEVLYTRFSPVDVTAALDEMLAHALRPLDEGD